MLVVSSKNSGCDIHFLISRNWCRELDSMSRQSFMLSTSLLLGHNFSFRLRHHSVVLNLQADRYLKLLVCLSSCRDVDIRSRPSSFFNHCNFCRDFKSMPRPFFLPIQSQPHFSVSTVSIQFSISGLDLTVLPFVEYMS